MVSLHTSRLALALPWGAVRCVGLLMITKVAIAAVVTMHIDIEQYIFTKYFLFCFAGSSVYKQTVYLIFYKRLFQRFQILAQRLPMKKEMVEGEGVWFFIDTFFVHFYRHIRVITLPVNFALRYLILVWVPSQGDFDESHNNVS